jgi:group II intron reverse transcriptase/maturase
LGIPAVDDKLVQEVTRMILEAIYEGHFERCSHGFRPYRSCHTALTSIQNSFTGAKWFIEGDIKGFFDNINHDIIIKILSERIADQRFLRLIRKFLNAGYMEDWTFHKTYSGTPQGGIISPILANIYLDKLDKYMMEYALEFNKGKSRKVNPEYKRIGGRKYKRVIKYKVEKDSQKRKDLMLEIKQLHEQMVKIPARLAMDENFKRLRYVRYADDFLIGVIGSKAESFKIKEDIKNFLNEKLKLELSDEKTLVTNTRQSAKFLGYEINVRKSEKTKRNIHGILKRNLGNRVVLKVTSEVIRKKLIEYKAVKLINVAGKKEIWKPTPRPYLNNNNDLEILTRYNSEIRGFYNYYSLANNSYTIDSFYNIMEYSMYKTFAAKYESTIRKIINKYSYNKEFIVKYQNKHGEKRQIKFYNNGFKRKKMNRMDYADNQPQTIKYRDRMSTSLMDRLKARKCEYCGAIDNLNMHQVRKVKNLEGKNDWEQLMIARRIKTMAVCNFCYNKIHAKN